MHYGQVLVTFDASFPGIFHEMPGIYMIMSNAWYIHGINKIHTISRDSRSWHQLVGELQVDLEA